MNKTLLDSLVAGGLGLALLLVIGIDNLIGRGKGPSDPSQNTITVPPPPVRTAPLRLAVSQNVKFTRPEDIWDDMAHMLRNLGDPYNKFRLVTMPELHNPATYKEFDVLFLTCSQEDNTAAIAQNVRAFVMNGGTLYASDWRYKVVSMAFPECADPVLAIDGDLQQLTADVVDPGLQDVLGPKLPLKFDLDQWKTAAFKATPDNKLKVLVKARYLVQGKKGYNEAPLLVKFGFYKGNVIFTSFHNEKQNSEVELKLLKYLVFSAVNANVESQIHNAMLQGGFSPQKSSLLSASSNQEVSNTYVSKKAGRVRFTLGFNGDAKLKLTVVTPDGRKKEQEGEAEFSIEESGPAGEWRYTITALRVPSANFSFNLQIGEKE